MSNNFLIKEALSLYRSVNAKKILSAFNNSQIKLNQLELQKTTGLEQATISGMINRLISIQVVFISHIDEGRYKYALTGTTIKDFIVKNITHLNYE